jgi:hypothetical protein
VGLWAEHWCTRIRQIVVVGRAVWAEHLCTGLYISPEFIDLDKGDKVNSGIGLAYRSASPSSLADWYDNPMPELTFSP